MGNGKKKELRTEFFQLRLTKVEKERIKETAVKNDVSVSEFIRKVVFDEIKKMK